MKPSRVCKDAGLKGLIELVEITGQSEQTLINWHKNKSQLFAVVVAGAVEIKKSAECRSCQVVVEYRTDEGGRICRESHFT